MPLMKKPCLCGDRDSGIDPLPKNRCPRAPAGVLTKRRRLAMCTRGKIPIAILVFQNGFEWVWIDASASLAEKYQVLEYPLHLISSPVRFWEQPPTSLRVAAVADNLDGSKMAATHE